MAGLVNSIKNDVKKAGTSKGNFTFIREGQKIRVRFLQDMDDGMEVVFHDSFSDSINVPCQEIFDRECPYCEDDRVRTRSQYIWCVYNYESKKVELFMFPVNNCSPVPALLAMYDTYGTITDRDYVISVSGKGPDKKYAVVPMDKAKFRNEKAKPFSEKKILQLLDKAYPCEDEDGNVLGDDEDDEDDFPTNKPSNKAKKGGKNTSTGKSTSKKKKPVEDDEDDDYDDEDWAKRKMMTLRIILRCRQRSFTNFAKSVTLTLKQRSLRSIISNSSRLLIRLRTTGATQMTTTMNGKTMTSK